MTAPCAVLGLAISLLTWPSPASAQHDAHDMAAMSPGWTWSVDAQAFLTTNFQERKFRDFNQLESQNWLMVAAMRRVGRASLHLHGMFSFEPFTMRQIGSAEVFQTGETYHGALLKDYQHPHDLVMGLGARFEWPASGHTRVVFEAAVVGEPALGPMPFMHRPSAESEPSVPLSHHHLDSTHITHGVITAGVTTGAFTLETSAFHGREPDEHRIAIEFGPIDSYSARLSWRRNGWDWQVSGGHLKYPDQTELTDVDRVTASVGHTGLFKARPLAWLFAWGVNREPGVRVTSPAWLAEAAWHVSPRGLLYSRAELIDQDLLTSGGYDPPGVFLPHVLSRIGALTAGYEREIAKRARGHFGLGADATIYRTPPNLLDSYGHPISVHIYLRYRSS